MNPAFEELFGRARSYNREHPEPNLRMDVCGYPYALFKPGSKYRCEFCHERFEAVTGKSVSAQVAYTDMSQAFGRRHEVLGLFCDDICADISFAVWKARNPEKVRGLHLDQDHDH